jgi:flagellar motor switch protein FliG
MVEAAGKITGVERAAILLMALGEQDASEILKHMGPKEVQKLGVAMASMSNVSRTKVEQVLGEFVQSVEDQTSIGVGSDDYVRSVLKKALGDDKAGGLIDRILLGGNTKGLEGLKWMEPRAVMEMIRLEHPQIIAIVLAYLDSDQSAEVLALFPEKVRTDLILRVAMLDGIQPSALQELNDIMEKKFAGNATSKLKSSSVGGLKAAANILNNMNPSVESAIIASVQEVDSDLAQKVQDLMFVFDNLMELDDRGVQTLLREVSSESLLLALKGSDEAMKEKIFKNMSKRAAEMLRDDLEAKGPVKLSEVETAQKEIVGIARRLAEAGELALGGKGGDAYV